MIPNPPPKEELYHYCPTESFFGFVSTKSLWLSNSKYANDPSENMIAYGILDDISKSPQSNGIGRFAKIVLETEFGLIDDISSYVFCFSENEEDLNQWRVYADHGYGYMIGFRPQYFLDRGLWILLDPNIIIPAFDMVYLAKCIYNGDQQRSIVERLLHNFAGNQKAEELNNIGLLKHHLKFYSGIFKHHSYSVENEWRIVCFPLTQPQPHKVKHELCFRSRRGVITQYVKQEYLLNITLHDRPFERVVLGPNVENTQFEIGDFLQFSEVPFRRIYKSKLKLR